MKEQVLDRLAAVPIAEQIATLLRNRIQFKTYRDGERLPGEWDLSEQFDVSRGTVRVALGILEKEGLVTRKQGKGTFVTASRDKPSAELPVIPIVVWDDHAFFPGVIRGASEEARSHGYSASALFTGVSGQHEGDVIREIIQDGMPGVLLATQPSYCPDYTPLREAGIHVVLIDQRRDLDLDYVVVDNDVGARLAVEHLIDLGHRSIVHLTHNDVNDIPTRGERIRGFRETCLRRGLDSDACPVLSIQIDLWEEARDAFEDWVSANIFGGEASYTACVCYNDMLAAQLMRAAFALRKSVPEDLSLVGFDNGVRASAAVVPITSVGWDLVGMGRHAMRILLERIERRDDLPPRGVVVGASLVVRESSAPPRGDA